MHNLKRRQTRLTLILLTACLSFLAVPIVNAGNWVIGPNWGNPQTQYSVDPMWNQAVQIVVALLVIVGPGVGMYLIGKKPILFCIGMFVGVVLGATLIPAYVPSWMIFGVVIIDAFAMYQMLKEPQ